VYQGLKGHERVRKTNKTERIKFTSTRVVWGEKKEKKKSGLNDCEHKWQQSIYNSLPKLNVP